MMRRTTGRLGGFRMQYMVGTGLWDEDHVNDYNSVRYLSARSTLRWYYMMERFQTRNNVLARRLTQTTNNNNGLHHTGKGAFERELQRRGVEVDKYPLTTTTGAARVAEMVLLRRQQMEAKAAELLTQQQATLRRATPSSWYDESKGPLNPRFLRSMQPHYTQPIEQLPNTPLINATLTS